MPLHEFAMLSRSWTSPQEDLPRYSILPVAPVGAVCHQELQATRQGAHRLREGRLLANEQCAVRRDMRKRAQASGDSTRC